MCNSSKLQVVICKLCWINYKSETHVSHVSITWIPRLLVLKSRVNPHAMLVTCPSFFGLFLYMGHTCRRSKPVILGRAHWNNGLDYFLHLPFSLCWENDPPMMSTRNFPSGELNWATWSPLWLTQALPITYPFFIE